MNLKHIFVTAALVAWAFSAAALPSVDAVQAEVQKGRYAQAETMMQEVVAAKPGSARAHYIYAEILAHNKRFDEARRQVSAAREIDPALSFTEPAKFRSLEQLLSREAQAEKPAAALAAPVLRESPRAPVEPQRSQGIPGWVWAFGLAGVAAVIWMMTRRRAVAPGGTMMAPAMGGVGGGIGPTGYGPGYGPGYAQPGSSGPGMLGVGLAAAGGVAAGMLAERLLDGGRREAGGNAAVGGGASGLVPGMFDDAPGSSPARELEDRPVDFGNGDGWGGGDAGGDAGGGGDGGDGGGW
jgi:hypothetical protein